MLPDLLKYRAVSGRDQVGGSQSFDVEILFQVLQGQGKPQHVGHVAAGLAVGFLKQGAKRQRHGGEGQLFAESGKALKSGPAGVKTPVHFGVYLFNVFD